jgi:hypothetical protein
MNVRVSIRATRWPIIAALTWLLAMDLGAQETVRPAPGQWAIGAELGGNAARGNSSYTTLTSGLRFTHRNKKEFELDWASTFTYGESSETVIARRTVTTLKADNHPDATWSPFIFTTFESDRIRRMNFASNTGVGAKWRLYRDSGGGASISIAAIHSYKSLVQLAPVASTVGAPTFNEPQRSTARISIRPKFARRSAAGVSFEQTTFWQPVYNIVGNYDLESTSRLGFATSKIGTVFFQHTYRADSRPPIGIKRDDQQMIAGIKLQF